GIDEQTIFGRSPISTAEDPARMSVFADKAPVIHALHRHCGVGADVARELELPPEAATAVAGHHEQWDGEGFPARLEGTNLPLEARIVAAADLAEVLIAGQPSSLVARKEFLGSLGRYATSALDPAMVSTLLEVARSDEF